MDPEFAKHVEAVVAKYEALIGMHPYTLANKLPNIPKRGIYLFSDGDNHLYVGRSNNLKTRIQTHCRPGSKYNQAAFAFCLACHATGQLHASYKPSGSRKQKAADPQFAQAFADGKKQIRQMDVRFVEENDSVRQYLLEVYAAIVLKTPHNSFDNH